MAGIQSSPSRPATVYSIEDTRLDVEPSMTRDQEPQYFDSYKWLFQKGPSGLCLILAFLPKELRELYFATLVRVTLKKQRDAVHRSIDKLDYCGLLVCKASQPGSE
ncbi:hypothetical protein Cob_v000997 [Colletotrichum orbiculare MAFF 240422]|uniref:Uncharacterized protein n=1 Tax=Colletotrichum orbiculare (strain 104-T / ATCC 96160 / CBS 514.97 / LARS 414 / MAFF 240422) TaxID=1213857 RepID=A0A484G9A2_COLOR|nr:hypothetical protein Cob_v000997 [Colletotrichum orbiculare MAFF 240422]